MLKSRASVHYLRMMWVLLTLHKAQVTIRLFMKCWVCPSSGTGLQWRSEDFPHRELLVKIVSPAWSLWWASVLWMFLTRRVPQWVNGTSGAGQLDEREDFFLQNLTYPGKPAWSWWPASFFTRVNVAVDHIMDSGYCCKWKEGFTFL